MKKKYLAAAVMMAIAIAGVFTACKMEVAEEEVLKPIIAPYISVPPASASYDANAAPAPLTAQVWDWNKGEGRLSYQWYGYDSILAFISGAGKGDAIAGASGDIDPAAAVASGSGIQVNTVTLALPGDLDKSAGKRHYYYLEITNTDSSATGATKKTVRSETATIAFNAAGGAKPPVINRQPASGAYQFGRSLILAELSARASSPDSGSLTYQWYYANEENLDLSSLAAVTTDDLTIIPGAESDAYRPSLEILIPGKNYFFVEITNTSANGTASDLSVPAIIDMEPGAAALAPVITAQPGDRAYFPGDAIPTLTVAAEQPLDGGALSYQWYRNSSHSARGGTAVGGATGATFALPAVAEGTTSYYYATVTNTARIKSGTGRASASSRAVRVVYGTPAANNAPFNMTVTVLDPRQKASRYQYVRGYGGMDVAWANFPEQKPADMETMYNPDWGLGYNMNRIMISPANTNVNISIRDLVDNHRPNYYENVKIVNKYGGYNLASPWSPPKEWKSNNSINGGGHLVYTYRQPFADYLRAFAKHMYDAGAPIYSISISNEPNYTAGYDGCEWTPAEMRDFYKLVSPQPFTTGIRGYGGGREIPRVLTMNGESANTPYINEAALLDPESRANIDVLARHVYGETGQNLWRRSPTGTNIDLGEPNNSATPNILDRPDGTRFEVWMTEHNINSANPTAYPNDSTWNYLWRYMNDVDLVMRLSNENAFVWWASKRFYSMIGDGQFGTRDGAVLPRGIGLSHYAKYTIDTHRVGITLTGSFADNTNIPNIERPASLVNNTTFDLDNVAPRISAYASIRSGKDNKPIREFDVGGPNEIGFDDEIEYISLVMWTPTSTGGGSGRNMGTIKLQMPAGFLIGGVSAHKSTAVNNMFRSENVQVNADRDAAFVTLGAGQILSVKLTRQ